MKARIWLGLVVAALGAVACGDDDGSSPGAGGEGGSAGSSGGGAGESGAGSPAAPGGEGGEPSVGGGAGSGGTGGSAVAGAGGEAGGGSEVAWYSCQSTEQAFVRRAVLAVLGRRPLSQAEVNAYVDLIEEIDVLEGVTDEEKIGAPGTKLRRSRQAVVDALFAQPGYQEHWQDLYRDFIRVQRIEEQYNPGCFAEPLSEDPAATAAMVRDQAATTEAEAPFSMYDVVQGSLALDDVTPIYTANIFAMLNKTYLGANATPVALELTRRRDFGAWFDTVYLHRDAVCLGCHNSEFSVTQSPDPAKNRHFPVGGKLEKSLFGASTGPVKLGGYDGGDRMHAALKYAGFVNDCDPTEYTQEEAEAYWYNPGCATEEETVHFCLSEVVCHTEFLARGLTHPWGMTEACGNFASPEQIKPDIAGVEAKFGNVKGFRASPWDLSASLRQGFEKLRAEGLGASETGEVADPDKAFAYLTAMRIAENAWLQIVGTPLTIPTRFPRNAASRDQLEFLTNTFVESGFSNRALVSAILASPYVNMAAPEAGCGDVAYAAPAVFDPWVIAEEDPLKRKNSAADGVVSLTGRTAAHALYAALGWQRPAEVSFPNTLYMSEEDPLYALLSSERQFQSEVGFYLKNSEPGFRGFDFQAKLGWEDRFATCSKLPGETAPDFIDQISEAAAESGTATARDLILALKDRLLGVSSIDEESEAPALEALIGQDLSTNASFIDPASLRQVCGVLVGTAQFLLNGIPPADSTEVPVLTPASAGYAASCESLVNANLSGLVISCNDDQPLTVSLE